MLTLPPKFKQALGNGTRTSLYPLVRIYKGVQIDDPLDSATEVINLSIKETNIGGEAYKGLLLNSPSISSKADIINNKYTISSVSLSISNAPYNGKIFSDDIPSLLNAVVQVYYAANGLETLDDCLLVYTGTIRRYSQSAETLNLTLEDLTEQKLKIQIPTTTIDDKYVYDDESQGKPFPLVYGYVDKSPLILTKDNELIIEQSNTEIGGLWTNVANIEQLNPYIKQTILYPNYLSENTHIFVYKDGYLPISERLPYNFGMKYSGYYEDMPIYEFENSTVDNSAKVNIVGDYIYQNWILGEDLDENKQGIPTRIYRPVEKVSFFANNHQPYFAEHPDTGLDFWFFGSCNKFFGFNNNEMLDATKSVYNFSNSSADQDLDNLFSIGDTYYDADWDETNPNATFSWWKPTDLNNESNTENREGIVEELDNNYKSQNKIATFPVQWIQNANNTSGLHLTAQNGGSDEYTTGSFARLQFADIGSYVCASKIFYKIDYFTPDNFENQYSTQTPHPVTFWAERALTIRDHIDNRSFEDMITDKNKWDEDYPDTNDWETHCQVPNHQHTFENFDSEFRYTNDDLGGDLYNNQIRQFNRTDAFDSIQWGLPSTHTMYYMQSVIANLKQFYLIQDILITDYTQESFYGSIKGRLDDNEKVMTKPYEILQNLLQTELDYQKDFTFPDQDIDDDWINSFTLIEQQEAKNVIDNLCKSSIYIPSFDSSGNFKFIDLKQNIEDYEQFEIIDSLDVIKYSFGLTKLEDVKNQVNVKYKKDYGSGDFAEETTYNIEDNNGNFVDTLDELTQELTPNMLYDVAYYGLKDDDGKLEVESEYIRDKDTARKLQRRLLMWYANQHLTAKIDLPPSYMHIETGDYIRIDELLGGKLAFGFDYTQEFVKNGQLIYPVFFVTKVAKSLSKVSLELVQVHRGDFGMSDDDLGFYNIPNPYERNIYQNEIDDEEPTFDGVWYQDNANLTSGLISAVTNTNYETSVTIESVTLISSTANIQHNGVNIDSGLVGIDATDLVNATVVENDSIYGDNVDITPNMNTENVEFLDNQQRAILNYGIIIKSNVTEDNYALNFQQIILKNNFNGIYGDYNQDGGVNILDIVLVLNDILLADFSNTPVDINGKYIVDMNGDSLINVLDIVMLINEILGN